MELLWESLIDVYCQLEDYFYLLLLLLTILKKAFFLECELLLFTGEDVIDYTILPFLHVSNIQGRCLNVRNTKNMVQLFWLFASFVNEIVLLFTNKLFLSLFSLQNRETFIIQGDIMSYTNLDDLADAVRNDSNFNHQIKGKRVSKQLNALKEYVNEQIALRKFQISASGISFFVQVQQDHRLFDFQILIDYQYPFNRPKIFLQNQSSPYSNCQDLLDTILEGNNWGPSLLISGILDKLPFLAQQISSQGEHLKSTYHLNDFYEQTLLERYKLELFDVEEYEWKYMIKSTSNKILALSKEHLLKFVNEGGKLKLDFFVKIKDIKEANATINNGKFKLDIVSQTKQKRNKLYFGGEEAFAQKILYFMNPIQVVQRQLMRQQKEKISAQELQEAIQKYSQLIEHYSLRDQQKTKKYVGIVQELIKKSYEGQLKQPIEPRQEDIKT